MKSSFLSAAALELEAAAGYHEDGGPGMGREFRREVRRVVALISEHPYIGHAVNAGTKTALREFNLNRFSYRLEKTS